MIEPTGKAPRGGEAPALKRCGVDFEEAEEGALGLRFFGAWTMREDLTRQARQGPEKGSMRNNP